MRRLLAAFLLLTAATASGAEVRVFAAASLTDALTEIAAKYEPATRDRIVFNFAGSNTLARQIESGAPADLFLSADEAKMDALQRQGLIDRSTRTQVLTNTLVIVSNDATIRGAHDLVGKSLALGEPSSVPAGIYAKRWLQRWYLWDRIAPKVIPTENVRAALAAVERGNADAAIIYATDARIAKRARVVYVVPQEATPDIVYPFAAVKGASPAARRFLQYLQTGPALSVFEKHGFRPFK